MLIRGKQRVFNLSHTINHLYFGIENNLNVIKSKFDNVNFITPLDNKFNLDNIDEKLFEYYLNIIPTQYVDLQKNKYNIFQFTVSKVKVESGMIIPTIYFRYDISPILLKYTKYIPNHFQSWINVCAIIGGLFTIISILDSIIIKICGLEKKTKSF
jgi:hypothetical protein